MSFDEAKVKGLEETPFGLAKKVLETWGRLNQLEARSSRKKVDK
jgi:hypothetical protein